MQELQKITYPRWANTPSHRVKYILLRTALELSGEASLQGLQRATSINAITFSNAIAAGVIKSQLALALELATTGVITRFDYAPELLTHVNAVESFKAMYQQQ